jgi:hypothetical protein
VWGFPPSRIVRLAGSVALSAVSLGSREAFLFSSLAARYLGEPGPAPHGIDVLVVGYAPLASARDACYEVGRQLAWTSTSYLAVRAAAGNVARLSSGWAGPCAASRSVAMLARRPRAARDGAAANIC